MDTSNFVLNAQHSGAINHLHSFQFSSSVVDVFREVRLGVTIVVVGWIAVASIRAVQAGLTKDRGS